MRSVWFRGAHRRHRPRHRRCGRVRRRSDVSAALRLGSERPSRRSAQCGGSDPTSWDGPVTGRSVASDSCADCGAQPGQHHSDGCDIAHCVACGRQALTCDEHADGSTPLGTWTGETPTELACREFGYYSRHTTYSGYGRRDRPDSGPLVPCPANHPHGFSDYDRLRAAAAHGEVRWDPARERYVAGDR
jgi:hypothetical protein